MYDFVHLERKVNTNQIFLYGASLGGVAAIDLATKKEIAGLIIDASFTNAKDMAKRIFPLIPGFLVSLDLDNMSKVKGLTVPKLFLHGRMDQTVPYKLGEVLYQSAANPKSFVELKGGHNDAHIIDQKKFVKHIESFIKEVVKK